MAFERPTLNQINERVEGDIKSELSLTAVLRRTFLAAMAKAIAGVSHILHGHLVFISRQIFPDQAEVEYLNRWGAIYGLERQPATFAKMEIDIIFTAATTTPAGTIYQRIDGLTYELTEDVIAAAPGTLTGTIEASEAGDDYNMDVGDGVTMQSPIAGIEGESEITAIVTEGEDEELDEDYRVRILARIQTPPSGGIASDYIAWAKEISGVTRAWVFPGYRGEGTVDVSFVEDNEVPIIPAAPKIAEVQDHINALKPVTADCQVFAPIANTTNFTISIKPNTADIRAAVTLELADLFDREAQVKGAYKQVGVSYDGKITLSKLNEAISLADGEEDHVITSHSADVEPATNGGLLILGTITFNTLA